MAYGSFSVQIWVIFRQKNKPYGSFSVQIWVIFRETVFSYGSFSVKLQFLQKLSTVSVQIWVIFRQKNKPYGSFSVKTELSTDAPRKMTHTASAKYGSFSVKPESYRSIKIQLFFIAALLIRFSFFKISMASRMLFRQLAKCCGVSSFEVEAHSLWKSKILNG